MYHLIFITIGNC